MSARRRGRCLALEVLYEYDIAGHAPMAVLARRLSERLEDEEETGVTIETSTLRFTRELIEGVVAFEADLDRLISRYAPEWPLDQIAAIDRNILRLAIYEMVFDREAPMKVAINEAVELAKLYGSDSTPRFVNGVLGSLAGEIEAVRAELWTAPRPSHPA